MERPDRIPKQRYYDADFFELERERLWPRVWQMACRLEEIPNVGDAVEYEILDQSVIVVRTSPTEVRAFQNACRHRGVKLVVDRDRVRDAVSCARSTGGATASTAPTRSSRGRRRSRGRTCSPTTSACGRCAATRGGTARGSTSTTTAPPLRDCLEPAARAPRRVEAGVDPRRVVARVPAPRQLEARGRGVHGAVPRARNASAAADPRPLRAEGPAAVRPEEVHRIRSCTTSTR